MKILLWWDKTEKKVQTFVLDIDASEGTLEGCAEAIKHWMKKVNNTITLLLKRQTAGSEGGGVLESLGNQLKKRDLCSLTYLAALCTLHAIQIALANLVKKTMGKGSLGARENWGHHLANLSHQKLEIPMKGSQLDQNKVDTDLVWLKPLVYCIKK